jgi:hypothetical protein
MHYTSIENIHKVIDPLFLDAYKEEFHAAMQEKTIKARTEKLQALQQKLAAIRCFDPACGSGNFLTESYLSLRRLENDILRETVTRQGYGSGVLGFGEAAYSTPSRSASSSSTASRSTTSPSPSPRPRYGSPKAR